MVVETVTTLPSGETIARSTARVAGKGIVYFQGKMAKEAQS